MRTFRQILSALLFTLVLVPAQAQDEPAELTSPYDAVKHHLEWLQTDTYRPERAAQALRAPGLSPEETAEKAIRLKQVLDGKGWYIDLNTIPDDPDHVDTSSGKMIYYVTPKDRRIYLRKIDGLWKYSASTVEQIDELFKEVYPFGSRLFEQFIPVDRGDPVLGLFIWQWIAIGLLLIVAGVAYGLFRLLGRIIFTVAARRASAIDDRPEARRRFAHFVGLWLSALGLVILAPALQLPVEAARYVLSGLRILHLIFATLLLLRVVGLVMRFYASVTAKTETKLDDQLIPILNTFLRGAVVLLAVVLLLRELGVDLRAILAGLSVGALALALAAQDTVKNFIGSLTIFTDAPFQIGDFVHVKGVWGTIEEVGVRSTRIRTTDQSLAYIPNGQLVNEVIDNLGLRIYRRWTSEIGVTYDTPPERIDAFVERARERVNAHPKVADEMTLLYLNNLGSSSINIYMVLYIDTPEWSEELETKHELLVELITLAHEMGVSFAFPSTSLYIENTDKLGEMLGGAGAPR